GMFGKFWQRLQILRLAFSGPHPGQESERDVLASLHCRSKQPVLDRVRPVREQYVVNLPSGSGPFDRVDQLGIAPAGPGPSPDLTNRFLVDPYEDDFAAGGPFVDVISDYPQPVLGKFACARHAK